MFNLCNKMLKYTIGERVLLSLRNGSLVVGTVIGTFQNRVQVGTPLEIFNSAGVNVIPTTVVPGTPAPFIEVFCGDIIAASGGNISRV